MSDRYGDGMRGKDRKEKEEGGKGQRRKLKLKILTINECEVIFTQDHLLEDKIT
jgi:hypothetical protein